MLRFSVFRSFITTLVLMAAIDIPVGATVTMTGDVDPGGATDPWALDEALYVGKDNDGILNIKAGGVISNTKGYIGYKSDSSGEVTVTGEDSQWYNSSSLYIGGGTSAAGGHGVLNIKDSARVIVSNSTKLWSTGTVNLNGGILDARTLDLTEGIFDMLDGRLHADIIIGD